MNISIIGASLEGLVLAAALANTGNAVQICDPQNEAGLRLPDQVEQIAETGLARLLAESFANQRLHWRRTAEECLQAQVVLVASRRLDTPAVLALAQAASVAGATCFVVSAPLPLGALKEIQHALDGASGLTNASANAPVRSPAMALVALPLFLREGSALSDWQAPNILVVGTASADASTLMQALLRPFMRNATHTMFVDAATAEFMRFSFSAMLATRLSLMNELACLAETSGVDIELVRKGLVTDPRIGADYLLPGCGFGGASLSRDILSLNERIKKQLDNSGLLDAVMAINESQKELLFRRLWRYFKTELKDKRIAIWGAAFKPGTGSTENSPVHAIIDSLLAQEANVVIYDPQANAELQVRYAGRAGVHLAADRYSVLQDADALLIVTAWNEFWSPDFARMKSLLNNPLIFDGRNIFEPDYVEALGFAYYGIGRGRHI